MSNTSDFASLFNDMFTGNVAATATPDERKKANALIKVASKSSASLSDVVQLADALDLQLSLYATPKPKEPTEEPTK